MQFWHRGVAAIRKGTPPERVHVTLVAAGWFAMGGYIASTIEHYANVFPGTDGVVALAGGALACLIGAITRAD